MQVEIGKIYEGTVKNITKYGAFVDIHTGDEEKAMGMVHISEISRSYVNEIRDFVTEGQAVKVKVIGINEAGRVSLSMKQTEPAAPQNSDRSGGRPMRSGNGGFRNNGGGAPGRTDRGERSNNNTWDPKRKAPEGPQSFEDMLDQFKQRSEEKIGDYNRIRDRKNRTRRK